jgi:hypothetical protein
MKRRRPRPLAPIAQAALLPAGFLLACLLPALLPVDWFQSRLWKGYYTVFVESALPVAGYAEELPARLASFGGTPPVSRHSAPASFNTFNGMATVSVAELPSRLDAADPRLDPYLQKLDAYFRCPAGHGGRELVYVRTRRGALFSGLGRLGPHRQVLELDPGAVLIRLLLLAGAALLVLVPARVPHVPRWLLGLGLLPWLLRVPTGDLRDLLAFLLLFPLWVRGLVWAAARQPGTARKPVVQPKRKTRKTRKSRRTSRRRRRTSFLPEGWDLGSTALRAGLVLLGAAVLLLAAPGVRHLPGVLSALAADLCLLLMLPAARRWERSRRAHTLFRALPILGALRAKAGPRKRRLSAAVIAVPAALALLAFAAAAGLGLEAGRRDLSAPRLERGGARGLSWDALAALPLSSDPAGLPHLADFLAHRAFQQSLAFQRPYRFPAPGERVYISGYAVAGNGYVQTRRVARRFPESWLRQTLAAAAQGSIERLLADQGRAAAVQRVGEPQLLRELAPWWRAAAVALFLLACLTAAVLSGTRTFAL